MMNIVVVDDKKFIRQGIVALLGKSGLDIGSIREFANGREALAFLRTADVDLVITDIRMPLMDGIELMERAQELERPPQFIVLSEFDEFKYAQKSMEHGAKAYILKPVDKIELIKVVTKAEEDIRREKGLSQKADQIAAKEQKLMKEELRLALLSSLHSDGIMEKLEQKGFIFGNSPFCVSLIVYRERDYAQDHELLRAGLEQAALEFADARSELCMTLELGDTLMVIAQSEGVARDFMAAVNRSGQTCFAAASGVCASCRDIREGYLQALEALKYRYLYPDRDWVRHAEIAGLSADYSLPSEEIQKLVLLIGTGKSAALGETVSHIFDRASIVRNKVEYLEDTVKAFYASLSGMANILSARGTEELKKYEVLSDIYHFPSVKDYLSAALEFVRMLDSCVNAMKSAYQHNDEIEKAIEYMEGNYDKDINLTMVSNYVSMNYSYFSHLFRAKTGVSFVEYLRKIRIHKAMELLSDSRMKISDISEKVGFNRYKHFTRSFVDTVGISPIEFRERKRMMEKIREDNDADKEKRAAE